MKNLKRSILALCIFVFFNVTGQTLPEVRFNVLKDTMDTEKVSYEYLLGHKVFLREGPSKKSKKLTILNIGTKLILTDKSQNQEAINGIRSHWYQVIVGEKKGWVWGGLIAQKALGSQANYDVKFVYGLESFKTNDEGVWEEKYQIRAFKKGIQIDKIVFDGHQFQPLEIKNIGNKGLFNVEDILTLSVSDGPDSISEGKMYVFWNNGKFTYVANLIPTVASTYTKSESFVFPSDMEGMKSTIILKTKITDYQNLENGKITDNSSLLTSLYTWNGYKLSKKKVAPIGSNDIIVSTGNSSEL